MKKIFTLIAMAVSMLTASATDYTGKLTVNVNGEEATPTQATISVDENTDGTYNLSLKNFVLVAGEDTMPVGTINIKNVNSSKQNGATLIYDSQDITIENGDLAGVEMWLGPMLGSVPVDMVGDIKNGNFHTVINIEFAGMEIAVEFGGDPYQLPNSGFENYHNESFYYAASDVTVNSDEANGWHMFLSGTATNDTYLYLSAYSLDGTTHKSTETRPGSKGSFSMMLNSFDLWIAVANGTATTGRLNVGSTTAADPSNHSYNDMSMTDVDGNGDPFYAAFNGVPDSLTVWVKFKQQKPNADYPYATINAVINDGTKYCDPEIEGYTSGVVAKATNATIESKDFAWQKLSIPFDYDSYTANNATGKAMLVTVSTNATPGKGSTDTLYVDDAELIYNAQLTTLKYNGQSVPGFSPSTYDYVISGVSTVSPDQIEAIVNGRGTYMLSDIQEETDPEEEQGVYVDVLAISNDLKTVNDYEIFFPGAKIGTSAINGTKAETTTGAQQTYNMAGQRTNGMQPGLNIIRTQDGKTVKVMRK